MTASERAKAAIESAWGGKCGEAWEDDGLVSSIAAAITAAVAARDAELTRLRAENAELRAKLDARGDKLQSICGSRDPVMLNLNYEYDEKTGDVRIVRKPPQLEGGDDDGK